MRDAKHSGAAGERVEGLASRLYDDVTVTEVIRPAAELSEATARRVLAGLTKDDVRSGGRWHAEPGCWRLFERPWKGRDERSAEAAGLIGSIQVAYGTPTKYEITIYRVSITRRGAELGLTVQDLTDEALGHGELSLAQCPRASILAPPKPFRF